MKVTLVANTVFNAGSASEHIDGKWQPAEAVYDDASSLAEFAGRVCYQSWGRPNPATANVDGYLLNIIDQQHFSVLEHGVVTFIVSEVSRSLTHELVRHRHFSYSQLSQRYVVPSQKAYIVPPLYEDDYRSNDGDMFPSETQAILDGAWDAAVVAYERLVAIHMPRLIHRGYDAHRARKMAREAARAVLPNMTPTEIVVTGNHRSWREFLDKRATPHADAEICRLAVMIYHQLSGLEPAIYQDFKIDTDDGREVLTRG